MNTDASLMILFAVILGAAAVSDTYQNLSAGNAFLMCVGVGSAVLVFLIFMWERKSVVAKERRKAVERIEDIPMSLLTKALEGVHLGQEVELGIPIFLPDSVRLRHVHVIGATGSGKTESVILNFLRQDVARGLGAIIMDAKGDKSFLADLQAFVPKKRLRVFDLSSAKSASFDPLALGTPIEAAQRLFSSLSWSEEYYKSKALTAIQRIFQMHFERNTRNPTLKDLAEILSSPDAFSQGTVTDTYLEEAAMQDYKELSGLRDQVNLLCLGHLSKTLSPKRKAGMAFEEAKNGRVLYFRLQSLLSPQLVGTVGKLLINQLNFLAGTAHRGRGAANRRKLIPTYLDEFASFVCPEFADLISKARSAGFSLHFSHQSLGDLTKADEGFLDCITDNSATKIVMRVNSPDTAEYFARTFGTKLIQKITQRITNVKELDTAEAMGEGSQREAHQFRASPDLLKTLPTGEGAVLIAHGDDTPHGASTVFRIRFPRLKGELDENRKNSLNGIPGNRVLNHERIPTARSKYGIRDWSVNYLWSALRSWKPGKSGAGGNKRGNRPRARTLGRVPHAQHRTGRAGSKQ